MAAEAVYPGRVQDRLDKVRAVYHLGWMWGLWLASLPLITFVASPRRSPIYLYEGVDTRETTPLISALTAIAVLGGAVPAILTFTSYRLDLTKAWRFVLVAMPIFFILQLSILQNPEATDLGSIVLGAVVFGFAALNASDDGEEARIRAMLGAFAVAQALLMVWVIADGNFLWGRLMGRVGPNFWGATAFYTLFPALLIRPKWLKAGVILCALTTLYLSQNRSSMAAVAAGFLVVFALSYLNGNPAKRAQLAWLALFGGAALVLFSPFLMEKVLLVSDPRRGLASGGTGRVTAWGEAWAVFTQHPWLGVGYRHHEHFISAASSAHNAYLATLADMGVVGLGAYMLMLISGLVSGVIATLRGKSPVDLALTGFVAAYAVHGLLEKRALNFGNSGSILFIFAIAWLMRSAPRRLPNLSRWNVWRRNPPGAPDIDMDLDPALAGAAPWPAFAASDRWEPRRAQGQAMASARDPAGIAERLQREKAIGRFQRADPGVRPHRAKVGDESAQIEERAAWPDVALDFTVLNRQLPLQGLRPF